MKATSHGLVAGGALLGCALTLLIQLAEREIPKEIVSYQRDPPSRLGAIRLTEGRLTRFGYAPYPTYVNRKRAEEALRPFAGAERQSTDWLRGQVLSSLVSQELGTAIANLERAVQREPDEAELLSDLSAIYSERARLEDRPEDYVAALDMAEQAIVVAPDSAEAAFNRALALEHLFLDREARKAWNRYLGIDDRSLWAEEARLHLGKLLALERRARLRNLIAESDTHPPAEAIRAREILNGRAESRARVPVETIRLWRVLEKELSLSRALAELDQKKFLVEPPRTPVDGQWATDIFDQKRPLSGNALTYYRRKLELHNPFEEESIPAQNDVANALESLGKPSEAWKYRYSSLTTLHNFQPPSPYILDALDSAVRASLKQGRPQVAIDFQSELIAIANSSQRPSEAVFGLLRRARIEAAVGRDKEAQKDFRLAVSKLGTAPSSIRGKFAAVIDVTRGDIDAGEARAAAVAMDLQSNDLLEAQADFDFRRGDTAAGEDDLTRAIEDLEQRREKVIPAYRISFLEQAQSLFERMIALQVHLGQPEKALGYLERFRARALLDQIRALSPRNDTASRNATPLSGQDLCRQMPGHTVLVVYAVIEDRLITWLIRPSGIELVSHPPAWPQVSTLVERLKGQHLDREVLEELDQYLIAPWGSKVQAGERIIFVPARSLYAVPFAALIDPGSGRFLVQDHALGVASSASQFIAAMERDREISATSPTSVLLVGNPSRRDFSSPLLPGSAREIEDIRRIYNGLSTRVLTGSEATPAQVLAGLGGTDIVHLSVHAEADLADSGRARLHLSSTESAPGDLSVYDILRQRLKRTRLVVIAACDSQVGPISASEGSLGLASAFLTAGVPAVVGSLWKVDDAATARLFVRFHQELRRGADALSALRTAQLEELARPSSHFDWTWASFEVFGGVAERSRQEH